MFVLILRQSLQCFAKTFHLWLFDNSKVWRVSKGRFGCWNFPFACVGSFGKSGRPIGADTNSCNPFENHRHCSQRGAIRTVLSELLVEMHMHEENSSSLIKHLSLRHDCPELEIHTMGVCDWILWQTNPHWDNWAFAKWNSPQIDPKPILFWEFCTISKDGLPIYWICLEYDEHWSRCHIQDTNGGSPIPLRIGWENVFFLVCWCRRPLLYCQQNHNLRVVYVFYGFLQC